MKLSKAQEALGRLARFLMGGQGNFASSLYASLLPTPAGLELMRKRQPRIGPGKRSVLTIHRNLRNSVTYQDRLAPPRPGADQVTRQRYRAAVRTKAKELRSQAKRANKAWRYCGWRQAQASILAGAV